MVELSQDKNCNLTPIQLNLTFLRLNIGLGHFTYQRERLFQFPSIVIRYLWLSSTEPLRKLKFCSDFPNNFLIFRFLVRETFPCLPESSDHTRNLSAKDASLFEVIFFRKTALFSGPSQFHFQGHFAIVQISWLFPLSYMPRTRNFLFSLLTPFCTATTQFEGSQ